jgi:glycosyltransferase involved in cell wall biosynthesis
MQLDRKPVSVLHAFSTFALGGPQSRFVRLMPYFDNDTRHYIASMDGRFEAMDILPSGSRVSTIETTVKKGKTLSNVRGFRVKIKSLRPEVLVTYNWGAIEWAVANFRTARHIHVEDGFGPEEIHSRLKRRNAFRKAILELNRSHLIVASETLKEIALKEWHVSPRRVTFIPNGVDIAKCDGFERLISKSYSKGPGTSIIIGTLAGLRPEKRIDRLIRACALLHRAVDFKLVVAGSGPMLDSLQTLARDLLISERVEFIGHVHDPWTFLKSIDIFALSSDTEQLPIALLEAMASKLPIVATNVGDIFRSVPVGQQPFVTAPEAPRIASALLQLIEDAEKRKALGQSNRLHVDKYFSERVMAELWLKALFVT